MVCARRDAPLAGAREDGGLGAHPAEVPAGGGAKSECMEMRSRSAARSGRR